MRNTAKYLTIRALALAIAAAAAASMPAHLAAQGQATGAPQEGVQAPPQPTFRVNVDLVTTDVIVRDSRSGQFVSDLQPEEIEIYEDGVKQELVSFVMSHGGRVFNVQAPPPAPPQEGIILPQARPATDTAGRVFLVFIDDLHFDFRQTPRARSILQRMLRNLIHEGDMFGIVTTGTSSISEQLTYDRQVLESAISRVTGSALRAEDIIRGSQSHAEIRHRAHVAFRTAYELMRNLERLRNRRKAVVYISSGYDFNPFEQSRLKQRYADLGMSQEDLDIDPFTQSYEPGTQFAEADLVMQLAELTRAANRANATFYTIDPRGLVAGPDLDEQVETREFLEYVRETQDSLRVLAEETGGIAVVNQNDFDRALKQIDAETSDYYVVGYYSSNPDPLRRTRRIEVRVNRPDVEVWSRTSYSLPPPPAPSQ